MAAAGRDGQSVAYFCMALSCMLTLTCGSFHGDGRDYGGEAHQRGVQNLEKEHTVPVCVIFFRSSPTFNKSSHLPCPEFKDMTLS